MPTDSAKVDAMRARARRKLAQETSGLSTKDKGALPQLRRRLAKKVRSSLPEKALTHAPA